MAKPFNPDSIKDAKRENRKESKKFNNATAPVNEHAQAPGSSEDSQQKPEAEKTESQNTENSTQSQNSSSSESSQSTGSTSFNPPPPPPPEKDEFKDRYDAYFKKMGGAIAGDMVVNLIDDLKTNFLYLYARKNNIDVPKEALKMDEKSRGFAAFLVDEAVKGKLFDWIKKYPLLGALGVFVISGGTTFLMLQMLKKSNDESKEKDELIEKLKREKKEWERKNATVVKDENEAGKIIKDDEGTEDLKDFIKRV